MKSSLCLALGVLLTLCKTPSFAFDTEQIDKLDAYFKDCSDNNAQSEFCKGFRNGIRYIRFKENQKSNRISNKSSAYSACDINPNSPTCKKPFFRSDAVNRFLLRPNQGLMPESNHNIE